jgi:hypothetical protein
MDQTEPPLYIEGLEPSAVDEGVLRYDLAVDEGVLRCVQLKAERRQHLHLQG